MGHIKCAGLICAVEQVLSSIIKKDVRITMQFDSPLSLFQHLLAMNEDDMEASLATFISKKHQFYSEVVALILAHLANKERTLFSHLISQQAERLVEDNAIQNLENTQIGVYKLTKKLGYGGMGAVYLGQRNDKQLKQQVAIKFIFPSIAAITQGNLLFKEAQYLANVVHNNIARVYTVDVTKEAIPYMVMEYIDGIPIDVFCNNGSLTLIERLKLFKKVCSAIYEAHKNLVIHADLKPSNILVDKCGEPKVLDFGIAQTYGNADNNQSTHSAASIHYASPEQLEGKNLSVSSDIYSAGKVLQRLIEGAPTSNHIVKRWVDECIKKCTEHDASSRVEGFELLIFGINKILNFNRPRWCEPKLIESVVTYASRNYIFISSVVLLSLVVAIFTYSLALKNQKLSEQNETNKHVISFLSSLFNKNTQQSDEFSVFELLSKNQSSKNAYSQQVNAHYAQSPFTFLLFGNHSAEINEEIKVQVINTKKLRSDSKIVIEGGGEVSTEGEYRHRFNKTGVYPVKINVKSGTKSHVLTLHFIIRDGKNIPFRFVDVAKSDQSYADIHYLALKGVLIGRPGVQSSQRLFEPKQYVKKAEALKIIMLAAYSRNIISLTPPHKVYTNLILVNEHGGIEDYSWASVFLSKIDKLNLLDSVEEFNPKELTKRIWLSEFIVKLLQLFDPTELNDFPAAFTDIGNFNNEKDIDIATIIKFYQLLTTKDGAFYPETPMTRREVAGVAAKILRLPLINSPLSTDASTLTADNLEIMKNALISQRKAEELNKDCCK